MVLDGVASYQGGRCISRKVRTGRTQQAAEATTASWSGNGEKGIALLFLLGSILASGVSHGLPRYELERTQSFA